MVEDLKKYTWWLLRWYVIAAVAVYVTNCTQLARNDSDPGSWGARSGLKIYTDDLTGCQYVSAGGGLTYRIAENGHSYRGCRKDQE